MDLTPTDALAAVLAKYVQEEASLDDLTPALTASLWFGPPDSLVDDVALAYAELTSRHRTEAAFRRSVARALSARFVTTSWMHSVPRASTTASASTTHRVPWTASVHLRGAGTQPATALA